MSRKVVTVAYGEPVHHVMQFDPADPGYLYLMTSHQVCPGLSLTRPQDVLSPSPSLPLHESGCSCQKHRPLPSGLPWPLLGRLIPRPTPRRDSLSFPSLSLPSPGCPSPAELGPPPLSADGQGEGRRVRRAHHLRGLRGRGRRLLRLVRPGDAVRPLGRRLGPGGRGGGGAPDPDLRRRPRCTLQQDCANSSQPHFWTSASAGPGRCPAMTVLPAEIDVHQEYPVSAGGQDPSSGLRGAGGEQPFPWHPDPTGGASWCGAPGTWRQMVRAVPGCS